MKTNVLMVLCNFFCNCDENVIPLVHTTLHVLMSDKTYIQNIFTEAEMFLVCTIRWRRQGRHYAVNKFDLLRRTKLLVQQVIISDLLGDDDFPKLGRLKYPLQDLIRCSAIERKCSARV